MKLSLSDRELIASSAERFIAERYPFENRARYLAKASQQENWTQMAQMGWLAMGLPEAYDGMAAEASDIQLLMKAFGCGLIGEPYFETAVIASSILQRLKPSPLVTAQLRLIGNGDSRLVLAHSETGDNFQPQRIKTTAQRLDKIYRISGEKLAIRHAASASHVLLTARCEDNIALFLVALNSAGVSIDSYPTIDSVSASDLHIESLELPESARLSSGDAWPAIKSGLLFSIACLCGEAHGITSRLLHLTADYLRNRQQFGATLASFQALQHRIADMRIMDMEMAAAATSAAESASELGQPNAETRIRRAKVRAGQLGRKIAEEAVQLHGGIGVTDELNVGHYLRRLISIDHQLGNTHEHLAWLMETQQE